MLATRRCAGAALALVLLLTAVGCGSGADGETSDSPPVATDQTTAPVGSPEADPTAGPPNRPEPGTCRPARTSAEPGASAIDEQAVSCDRPHAGEVVAVVDLPEGVAARITPELIEAGGEPYAAALGEARTACDGPLQAALDAVTLVADPPVPFQRVVQGSALRASVTTPTAAAWEAGARWLACELTAVGPDGQAAPYVGALAELGGIALVPTALASCVDGSGQVIVACEGSATRLALQGTVDIEAAPEPTSALGACAALLADLGLPGAGSRGLTTTTRAQDEDTVLVDCLLPASADLG